ncbi:Rpn family recombination-promoting nuclease/putative transposase [Herbivorax sp. ANBcel31]|uniref:Rpn family recombination-promoting nuclease/putative transposase n=1 Tax=Herbivorax sp. ANBcel31 TaxID=3069754 RepID=UPI0027B2BA78|nr:Rpn family recombination-promoting nuclease/putative transposase [Herbivorax sp. ANBcel31]MDQ2085094.1 Rpn family recombination-promoting nuclease/putative transposase [Herbivorax sp. ANBcel31]
MNNKKKEKIKLDQMMKVMFKLSKKVTVNLLNGLFDENYDYKKVKIEYGNGEFFQDNLKKIQGDMFITVQSEKRSVNYHIEFQTQNDKMMAIRMFRYGFEKALELTCNQEGEEIVLDFPKQSVIYLEENQNIKDMIVLKIRKPDGSIEQYEFPTMKYWEYTQEELINKKMYALLPFQVFNTRKAIENISNSSKAHEEKAQLIKIEFNKLIKVIESVGKRSAELYEEEEIKSSDFERILLVLKSISDYIYNKYGEYKQVEKEVETMLTSLYNPAIAKESERKKALKVAREAIKEGADVDFIAKITELDKETVIKIKEELQS